MIGSKNSVEAAPACTIADAVALEVAEYPVHVPLLTRPE